MELADTAPILAGHLPVVRGVAATREDRQRAALIERDGLVYANDGDWVESLTALAEDHDGALRLLDHNGQTLVELPGARLSQAA